MPTIYQVGDGAEVMRSDGSWSKARVTDITAEGSIVVVMIANGLSKTVPAATAVQYLRKTEDAAPAPTAPGKPEADMPMQRIKTDVPTAAPIAPAETAGDKDESESDDDDEDDDDDAEESESESDDNADSDDDSKNKQASDGEDDANAGGSRVSRKVSVGRRATINIPVKAGLTERHVQALREIFGLFEMEDEQGCIIPAEVRTALAEAGLQTDSPEIWNMVAGFDSTEPIDFEEFIALVAAPLGDRRSRAGASRLVALLGPGALAEGSVGIEDLKSVAEELAIDLDADDLLDMLERAGVGPDGRLSLDDFYTAMQDPE